MFHNRLINHPSPKLGDVSCQCGITLVFLLKYVGPQSPGDEVVASVMTHSHTVQQTYLSVTSARGERALSRETRTCVSCHVGIKCEVSAKDLVNGILLLQDPSNHCVLGSPT